MGKPVKSEDSAIILLFLPSENKWMKLTPRLDPDEADLIHIEDGQLCIHQWNMTPVDVEWAFIPDHTTRKDLN
jgi:hypothetical protein